VSDPRHSQLVSSRTRREGGLRKGKAPRFRIGSERLTALGEGPPKHVPKTAWLGIRPRISESVVSVMSRSRRLAIRPGQSLGTRR
jgi:hypothetical protein